MSVSIYYEARRAKPLSDAERAALEGIAEKYSVDERIREYVETGRGLNWESFELSFEPRQTGVILQGATKPPDNTEDAAWTGIQHWCAALSEIRRRVADASWRVSVEDHEIPWDESKAAYDPSK